MPYNIKMISLVLRFKLGAVNCFLIQVSDGYVLIDTGGSNKRKELERELGSAGCEPGNLRLIILTHGDFDHTGNAAYLSRKFDAEIAMHNDDLGMVERGNMFWNRKKSNIIVRMMTPMLFGFGKSERFTPDIYIKDGDDFSKYGFDAKAIYIPGHSKGSTGILTVDGDFFCGDLLENIDEPKLNSIMDDLENANVSVEKVKGLNVNAVYPGHGKPFQGEKFFDNYTPV